jgi:glutaminyl-tRNA synthetase
MSEEVKSLNFIEEIVETDIKNGKHGGRVLTRFPPEPNGYLHIGHAKSICLNFGLADEYGGKTNLRFDDTNPETEETEYVESIKNDIRWLGFQWDNEFYASDYFDKLYEFAVQLIKDGLAYVDDLSSEEIAATKGTPTEPGKNSPCRDRSVAENLDVFERMKNGEFKEGERVLRAKIDMASLNMHLRDPSCIASSTQAITVRVTNGVCTRCMILRTDKAIPLKLLHILSAPWNSKSIAHCMSGSLRSFTFFLQDKLNLRGST